MAWLAFFHGDTLSLLFAKDAAVAAASHSYLKAYAIDCMLTPSCSASWGTTTAVRRPSLS